MKILPYLASVVILIGCKAIEDKSPANEIVIGPLGEKFDHYLSGLEPFGLSGSFLISHKDTIVFHKAYGLANRKESSENSINTLFSVGSITKQFTATAILKLEQEGKLNTSNSIAKYIENVPEDKSTITIHHLLTHTSGLPAIVSKNDFDAISRNELLEKLFVKPLAFEPGTDYLYSNSAYGLLAIIIEDISGKSYEDFLTEAFFRSSDITTIGYDVPAWKNMEEAHNYVDSKDYGRFQDRNYPNWNLVGNGGLLSTSMDLYRWMTALKNKHLIEDASLTKMFTPFLEDYGYGWEVFEDNGLMIEHTGSGDGNNSIVQWYVDKDIIFIGLSNYSFDGLDLLDYMYDDVYQIVHGQEIQSFPKVNLKTIESEDLTLAGRYLLDSNSQIIIQPFYKGFQIQTLGQEARNLFVLGSEYTLQLYDQKNKTAFEVFRHAIEEGDFSDFSKLIDDEKRLTRTRKYLTAFVQDLNFKNPKVHPYISERNEDGLQSYVAISDGDKEINTNKRYPFLSLVWREDGSYRGIGSVTQVPRNPSYYFVKNEANELVGYNWNNKKIIKILIERSKKNPDMITINFGGTKRIELEVL